MKKTLLVIGDPMMTEEAFEPSLNRFITYKPSLNKRGIGVIFITYDDVISGRLPNISTKRLDVILFFPYNNWNSEIERYDRDDRVYGDIDFGSDYVSYLMKVDKILKRRYRLKNLNFVNPPKGCIVDRDKLETYNQLKRARIRSPHIYNIRKTSDVDELISKGRALYVKPRFGAMGKGITYIDKSGTYTNFLFKSNSIISRLYDYNWKPAKVSKSNRDAFLKILMRRGFIFQREVKPLLYNNRKFDIRVYVVYDKVPYLYAKSAPDTSFITNWSQGGRIEKRPFLNASLTKKEIEAVKRIARKAAKTINFKFAGVDVIIDRETRDMHVLEIQSFPGYERGFDLMKFLADKI
ncbi:MAG: hypothetical protein RAP41_02070 [Candidatus Orphnella occulta]|nr:hypothetical protein [Candidatus Orphnella occulta]MDP8296953.1 hypothetical protein [Candidatus Orphnella occulta]